MLRYLAHAVRDLSPSAATALPAFSISPAGADAGRHQSRSKELPMRLKSALSLGLSLAALAFAPALVHAQAVPQSPATADPDHITYGRDAENIKDQIAGYNALLKDGENGLSVYQNTTGVMYTPISPADQVAGMGAGVNLFEGDDAYWSGRTGNFNDSDIKAIADAGLKTIRVPLFAFAHIVDAQGNLDPAYLAKLDHLIDLATANHLNIILDEHNYTECAKDVDGCGVLLSNVWYDLALRYQTAPSNVIFEILNEPNGNLDKDIWNGWLPDLVAQVRQFDPSRNIIIGPTMWNSPDQLDTLKLPADDHIIVTFHYYTPMEFTHQGANWAGPELEKMSGVRWTGTADQVAVIDGTFDKVKAWSTANNRPIFLGEFGSYAKVNKNLDDRAAWTRAVSKAASDRGFARALWVYEGSQGFGIHDAGKGWVAPLRDALVNP